MGRNNSASGCKVQRWFMPPDTSALLNAAFGFLERGWTPLPIAPRGKEPLIRWQRLQRQRPTAGDLEQWWSWWPLANVGIVTGMASGLAVLDLDGPEAIERAKQLGLPDAPGVQTARGMHFYCSIDGVVRSAAGVQPGIDLRAEGGYVVAPPSLHPTGIFYTWVLPPVRDLPPLPEWAARPGTKRQETCAPRWAVHALRGAEKGRRNITCAKLAGYFLAKGVSPDVVEATLLAWNQLNRPPLPADEVRRTVLSIALRGRRQRTEALPFTERSLIEFLTGPWAQDCTHGERSTYQVLCIIAHQRGLPRGTTLYVSYRELAGKGGVSVQRAHHVLTRLARRGLIEFEPAGQADGLRGRAATVRLLPLPSEFLNKGETNQGGDNYLN